MVHEFQHGVEVVRAVVRKGIGELCAEAGLAKPARAPDDDGVLRPRALDRLSFNRRHGLLVTRVLPFLPGPVRDGACACVWAGARRRRPRGTPAFLGPRAGSAPWRARSRSAGWPADTAAAGRS